MLRSDLMTRWASPYLMTQSVPSRCRRLWPLGRCPYRKPPGEVAVRAGRVLPDPVPQPADAVWQTPAPVTQPTDGQLAGHRTALFRQARGQDAHRDAHPRHASLRELLQLALHAAPVTSVGGPRHAGPLGILSAAHRCAPLATPWRWACGHESTCRRDSRRRSWLSRSFPEEREAAVTCLLSGGGSS